jgi:RimJ/RimL family protein N-acetyltransferase
MTGSPLLPEAELERSPSEFKGYELYILLSDRCNFSCAHCLNHSGPQAKRWSPTEDSLLALADEINHSPKVSLLHFSGGEPTLHLPEIQRLLSQVHREIPVVLTTNGWFATRTVHYLDEIPLKGVELSFDRFHAPFISLEKLIPLIHHLKKRGIEVSFNFVFDTLPELADLAVIRGLGVPVRTSRLIQSGRGTPDPSWIDSRATQQTCPSLNPQNRHVSHLEKVIYLSGKGFTPCCGPLVFDELVPETQAFSSTLDKYSNNALRKALQQGTFAEQASFLGLDLTKVNFQTPCQVCALLHGAAAPGLPSTAQIIQRDQSTIYFPFKGTICPEQRQLLLQKFMVGYTETLQPEEIQRQLLSKQGQQGEFKELTVSPLAPENHPDIIEFVKKNYYFTHSEYCPPSMAEAFVKAAPEYLNWESVRGNVYRKEGQTVGTIFVNRYDPHPALGEPTLHIGYWGYDRNRLTQAEARWIKAHWLSSLHEWSEGRRAVDASFDYFNEAAIRLARALGFERKLLRLNRVTP